MQTDIDATFFVAKDGSDAWSGRLAAPNAGKTDGPFATLVRARNAIRKMRAGEDLDAPVTVMVRGGRYYLERPLALRGRQRGNVVSLIDANCKDRIYSCCICTYLMVDRSCVNSPSWKLLRGPRGHG
ncbi:MAG: hypothetical protein CMJ18_27485 [Phycisphaeraceae bacterium]|nr:hypothetical protein [Phycisphaeraceae bacterium]